MPSRVFQKSCWGVFAIRRSFLRAGDFDHVILHVRSFSPAILSEDSVDLSEGCWGKYRKTPYMFV